MSAPNESWTVGKLLLWTTDFLKQHGVESPRLDAEVLLAAARSCERIELYAAYDDPASDSLRDRFRDLVRRRAQGTPVAYLVGHREFYSLSFAVAPGVLIPRPETEFLVIAALDYLKSREKREGIRGGDICTGSGNVAIALAKSCADCRLTAVDLSTTALEIARQNAAHHEVSEQIEFVAGNLLEPLSGTLDFVVCNPPYVTESEYAELPVEVREYEPREALVAGPQGTEVIADLLAAAPRVLRPGGGMFCELSPMIAEAAEQIALNAGYEDVQISPDLAGNARVLKARWKASAA